MGFAISTALGFTSNFCRYNVMLKCWEWDSKQRPTFTEIRTKLDEIFGETSFVTGITLQCFVSHLARNTHFHFQIEKLTTCWFMEWRKTQQKRMFCL